MLGDTDVSAYAAADPEALLLGCLDGVPAASVLAIRHGEDFGFIGLYITRADLRGRGYGRRMWRAAVARLEGRLFGLDAVPEQQEAYMRLGLRPFWWNVQFSGIPQPARITLTSVELVAATALPFDVVAAYDREYFPVTRNAFLAEWIDMPGVQSLAALHEGRIVGFGTSRPSHGTCSRVGPLYADSSEIASVLLRSLATMAPNRAVAIDAPESNPLAKATMEQLGLKPRGRTVRMYNGTPPTVRLSGIYGTTSLEAG
ncbi:GNAT family N-acetyltransferase [Streptomyces sp. SCSIO 30461]|uniref:GNAT family N-acetyltransferase n=1 Tax=Streptomyces sp. SCSIO 30461 TaxID=3118085 RepID=UPI0030CCD6BB